MPTKKESTATAVTETKTAKAAVKKTTGAATKTKAAAETAKKAAAQVKKGEAESAPSVAKEKKRNTVRAQKANAGAVKAKTEEVKEEPANITEEPKEVKETLKKAEPKKPAEEKKKADVAEASVKAKAEVAAPAADVKAAVKAEEPQEETKPKAKKTASKKTAKTTKTAAKTVKKTVKAEEPAAEDAEAKPKKTVKKTAAKKAAKTAEVKDEAKVEVTAAPALKAEPAKAEVKAEPAKETAKAKKEAAPKTVTVKEEVKAEEKPARKPVPELTDEKIAAYRSFPMETLMEMVNAAGFGKSLDDLKHDLANTLDVDGYIADSMINALNKDDSFSFEDDGFDVTVIPFVMDAVYQALPYKASAATDLEKSVHNALEMKLGEDGMKNADVYNTLMDLVRQILEVGQKQNMNTLDQVNTVIPGDLRALIEHFMNVAYDLLPYWSYDDVKFYEGFIYAVLSQFSDLADLQNRAMMDVADLYIKHGDYGRGDADYNYVIRENQLKDQIYYRFANVYRNFDPQKAKSIAASALQYVDGRYDYYPRIMEILNS